MTDNADAADVPDEHVPAFEVYELTVDAVDVAGPRSLLRSAWAWFIAFSPDLVYQLFSHAPRNDSIIRIVSRKTGHVVREYQCRTDGEALRLESGLRNDLQHLNESEFNDQLDL